MNPLWPALRRALADLGRAGARSALVGGLAAGARTEPRFTRDIDFAVSAASDEQAESIVRALLAAGYRASAVIEQEAVGRLATVRLVPEVGDGGVVVDLLFASCGIEAEIVDASQPLELAPGLVLPIARTGQLIAMKLLSDAPARPQDRVDLVRLVAASGDEELQLARQAIRLIEARGFARGRDLEAALATLLTQLRTD